MYLGFSAGEKQREVIVVFGNKKCEVSFKRKEKRRSRRKRRKEERKGRWEDIVVKGR